MDLVEELAVSSEPEDIWHCVAGVRRNYSGKI